MGRSSGSVQVDSVVEPGSLRLIGKNLYRVACGGCRAIREVKAKNRREAYHHLFDVKFGLAWCYRGFAGIRAKCYCTSCTHSQEVHAQIFEKDGHSKRLGYEAWADSHLRGIT